MPRNMSFMLTTDQVRDREKRVTRRNGWTFLKAGDVLNAVEKAMGLRKGEKVVKLATIRVLDVRREPLNAITQQDCIDEGFGDMMPDDFVTFYGKHNKKKPDDLITRIEFEYLD